MLRSKNFLGVALAMSVLALGIQWIHTHVELATLHVRSGYQDHFVRVFVVDAAPAVWVRAERPDRLWLASLRANPNVTLRRGELDLPFRAEVWERGGARRDVDALFRAKYGAFDAVSAFLWRRDAVPIRLQRR